MGEQRERLPGQVAYPAEHLVAGPPLIRIDGRADQRQRPRTVGELEGKLGDDLAAHRVGDERRPLELERVQAAGERLRQTADAERRGWLLAAAAPGQLGDEHREPAGERLREREHVPTGDAEPVYEHDGLAFARRPRVDAQTPGHDAATGNYPTGPRPHNFFKANISDRRAPGERPRRPPPSRSGG